MAGVYLLGLRVVLDKLRSLRSEGYHVSFVTSLSSQTYAPIDMFLAVGAYLV